MAQTLESHDEDMWERGFLSSFGFAVTSLTAVEYKIVALRDVWDSVSKSWGPVC